MERDGSNRQDVIVKYRRWLRDRVEAWDPKVLKAMRRLVGIAQRKRWLTVGPIPRHRAELITPVAGIALDEHRTSQIISFKLRGEKVAGAITSLH